MVRTVDSTEKIRKLKFVLAHGSRLRAPLRQPSSVEVGGRSFSSSIFKQHEIHVGVVSRQRIYCLCGRY
jgi:hypothetical protein